MPTFSAGIVQPSRNRETEYELLAVTHILPPHMIFLEWEDNHMKRGFWAALAVMAGVMFAAAVPVQAADMVHRVVIHVDDNDKKRIGMALNNAQNIDKYYKSKGEKVEIEVVAYGPGLHMLREDTSPVKQRIASMGLAMDNLRFSACGNTHKKMSAKKKVELVSEAKMVPSGVIRLMELQEKGWSYIRP